MSEYHGIATADVSHGKELAPDCDLTLAQALLAEMIRRYGALGFECAMQEVQELAWFLHRTIGASAPANPLTRWT
jgi:hypothetical protein